MLKPQDIYVLLKITSLGRGEWTYPGLAKELFMSPSEVHASIKRCRESQLIDMRKRLPRKQALLEFLIHGVPYAYPAHRGSLTRGMATSFAAPPLDSQIVFGDSIIPVWPYGEGNESGYELEPLHKSAPKAALKDRKFYELLTLVDTLRDGRARERQLARHELEARLNT